jgi:hypothetical protein
MAKFTPPLWVGFFDDPESLLKGASQAKEMNFENLDAFTPYPVHGLESALGLKRSWVPYVTLICGLSGATLGYLFMLWTSALDWPLNIGGKPFHSWPAFVPITFEMGILFGGVSTFIALLVAANLPRFKPFVIDPQLTNNRFALVIPEKQEKVREDIERFLTGAGAVEIKRISA